MGSHDPGAARCRLLVEHSYHPLTIICRKLLMADFTRQEYAFPIQALLLSGLLVGDTRCGTFEQILDCLFGDDDPLAEAEGRQPASARHFISEGTADAQEFSSFLHSKSQSLKLHGVFSVLTRHYEDSIIAHMF